MSEQAAVEQELDEIWRAMTKLAGDDDQEHYALGSFYNTIVKKRLAEEAGYTSAFAYLDKRCRETYGQTVPSALSRASLLLYSAVASHFSREDVADYGFSKLARLLAYWKAIELPTWLRPEQAMINVPQKDGTVAEIPFSECTRAMIDRAIRHARKPPENEAVAAVAQLAQAHIQAALDATLGLDDPSRVRTVVKGGKRYLNIEYLPLNAVELPMVLKALSQNHGPESAMFVAPIVDTMLAYQLENAGRPAEEEGREETG